MTSFIEDFDDQSRELGGLIEPADATDGKDYECKKAGNPKAADILVDLVLSNGVTLFHDLDLNAYASVPVAGKHGNYRLDSRFFKRWIGRLYYEAVGSVPPDKALQDALAVLEGKAVYDGEKCNVYVRLAQHNGNVVIDLGDESWNAVIAGPNGWEISNSPVKFVRPRGMRPLPVPIRGGNIEIWRKMLNITDQDAWILFITVVVSMLRPGVPFVILVILGEQGSSKSTTCRQVRMLIDPNMALLRAEPRDVRDLVIAAQNSLLMAFDNLSYVPPWLSDALCRLSTGGGFATRELYANDSEVIFDARRPLLINGISEVTTRSDLLDRTITITLPPIDKYRTETAVTAEFEALRPALFGAIVDLLCFGLMNLPNVCIDRPPRMADFAHFGAAIAPRLGTTPEAFLNAYNQNRQGTSAVAMESSPIVPAILHLMTGQAAWTGVSRQLLRALELYGGVEESQRRSKAWPKTARQLTEMLKRLAPNLRAYKLKIEFGEHSRDGIGIRITWIECDVRDASDVAPGGGK